MAKNYTLGSKLSPQKAQILIYISNNIQSAMWTAKAVGELLKSNESAEFI